MKRAAGHGAPRFVELGADLRQSLDWWMTHIRRIKDAYPTRVVIASIMAGSGSDKELRDWQLLAEGCQEAGADGFECNFSCPHMDRQTWLEHRKDRTCARR